MSEQQIILPSGGALPGIPGDHAPGAYWVDYDARTIRPDVKSSTDPIATQQPGDPTPPEQQQPAQE